MDELVSFETFSQLQHHFDVIYQPYKARNMARWMCRECRDWYRETSVSRPWVRELKLIDAHFLFKHIASEDHLLTVLAND